VLPHAVENLRAFLSSSVARKWTSQGSLCSCEILPARPRELPAGVAEGSILVEHQPIRFPNYPYEWSPEMLRAAGELTLRLALESLRAGFLLKDATPYNIMFEGLRPVFLDVLSFAPRDPLDPIWPPYAQFVRTFVYPLVAGVSCGAQIGELLLSHRDGLTPDRVAHMLGARRFLPRFLASVALPALLSNRDREASRPRSTHRTAARDAHESEYVLASRFRKAQRLLPQLPAARSTYLDRDCIYSASEFAAKKSAVAETLERFRPQFVLDIGCNDGQFSLLAAGFGAAVVAIDRDASAAGALWNSAQGHAILPLVIDIARPPGACGWANAEFPSFLDRARGRFDCVLMLALLHHLSVDERVPLPWIFDLAAQLTRRLLIAEYVDPADPQFQTLARGRDALHRDLTVRAFEDAARERFLIVESRRITPTRAIYVLEHENR